MELQEKDVAHQLKFYDWDIGRVERNEDEKQSKGPDMEMGKPTPRVSRLMRGHPSAMRPHMA